MPYFTRVLSQEETSLPLRTSPHLCATDIRLQADPRVRRCPGLGVLAARYHDEVEIAVLERNPVDDGSTGQDEIAISSKTCRTASPSPAFNGLTASCLK